MRPLALHKKGIDLSSNTRIATTGPLSFVGGTALLYAAAFLPAAKLAIESLAEAGMPITWSLPLVALSYPSLLFPSLPKTSQSKILCSPLWMRMLVALPAALLGFLLCQFAIFESFEGWNGITSIARTGFGLAAATSGTILVIWDSRDCS